MESKLRLEASLALGGQFEGPNGVQVALGVVQVALGGQLDSADGVQVALGITAQGFRQGFPPGVSSGQGPAG